MHRERSSNSAGSRTALACLVLLLPFWIAGVQNRGYWTPDEPRERDIAWRMTVPDASQAVPNLAGTPILEKPPAYYWGAAASSRLWPASASAARLPNVLYAVLALLDTVLWARGAGVKRATWLVGVVGGTFLAASNGCAFSSGTT